MSATNRHRALEHLIVVVLAVVAAVLFAGIAAAAEISIAVGAPQSVTVGDTVTIKAIVTSAGDPVKGAVVSLSYSASFAGVEDRVELDRETTGSDGVAMLTYEQRAVDNGEMQVGYVGPDDTTVEPLAFTIGVQPGAQQQHRSQAGVSIWWLNGWLLIGLIMIVWGSIVYSAFQLVIVGRESDGGSPARSAGRLEEGAIRISVLLATVTVITAVGMVIVFVRNPLTHTNLDDPGSYSRTPVARVGVEYPYLGPGLSDPALVDSGDVLQDGRLAFFEYGCAGCHGLSGNGAIVGPELRGEVGSQDRFAEDVREGPKNMPAYSSSTLSDEDLAKIHAFLKETGSDG